VVHVKILQDVQLWECVLKRHVQEKQISMLDGYIFVREIWMELFGYVMMMEWEVMNGKLLQTEPQACMDKTPLQEQQWIL